MNSIAPRTIAAIHGIGHRMRHRGHDILWWGVAHRVEHIGDALSGSVNHHGVRPRLGKHRRCLVLLVIVR
jgi:hypothetical protein